MLWGSYTHTPEEFCVSSLISYGRSGGKRIQRRRWVFCRVFLLLSWDLVLLLLSFFILLFLLIFFQEKDLNEKKKTGGQKAVAFGYIIISSPFFFFCFFFPERSQCPGEEDNFGAIPSPA
jgi:hypothetical protein